MDATVVLTYREGSTPDRRENLHAVLAWLATMPTLEVVVVEQDRHPRLAAPLPHPACRVLFAYNPGPFNKGWGHNVGVRVASTPVVAFADADVVVHGTLLAAVALCRTGFQLVKPYRRLVDLTPEETAQVRGGRHDYEPARSRDAPRDREGIGETLPLCGGVFVIRGEPFAHLGGYDERFVGWGGEDDALSLKVQRVRLSTIELDERPALHLWHPRPPDTTSGQPHYLANRALLAGWRASGEAEFDRLCELQRQLMGHREKYRPEAA